MKDPAFLFYSKDFYEGTRMMLPEERACFVDLLIYQHQNGVIPNDLKRVLMYCSGVSEATLIATLKAKFKHTSNGWVNSRLEKEINQRNGFKNSQSQSGKIGQFWKKVYQILSAKDIKKLKKNISKDQIISLLNEFDFTDENTLKGSLKQRLSKIANVIEDVIEDEDKNEKREILKTEKLKLVYPFESENFKVQWQFWKEYKQKQFKFNYKSEISEQAALKSLAELAQDEKTAIEIIHQSIGQGWKGFFELKNNHNGNQVRNKTNQSVDNIVDAIYGRK